MIRLLQHHVLIQLDEPELRTESGIIIATDEKKERKAMEYGTVIQVGPTAFEALGVPHDAVQAGDKVTFTRYSGKDIKVDGKNYVILNDEDILAIVK
jgi:chaperonin GroES